MDAGGSQHTDPGRSRAMTGRDGSAAADIGHISVHSRAGTRRTEPHSDTAPRYYLSDTDILHRLYM